MCWAAEGHPDPSHLCLPVLGHPRASPDSSLHTRWGASSDPQEGYAGKASGISVGSLSLWGIAHTPLLLSPSHSHSPPAAACSTPGGACRGHGCREPCASDPLPPWICPCHQRGHCSQACCAERPRATAPPQEPTPHPATIPGPSGALCPLTCQCHTWAGAALARPAQSFTWQVLHYPVFCRDQPDASREPINEAQRAELLSASKENWHPEIHYL